MVWWGMVVIMVLKNVVAVIDAEIKDRGGNQGQNHFRGRGCGQGYVSNYRSLKYDQTNKNRQDMGKMSKEVPQGIEMISVIDV